MKNLFTPISIGTIEISNRIFKSAAGSYSIDHGINDQAMMFYENIAKGGVGMIWFEDLQWYGYPVEDVRKVVDKVHDHGTKIGLQTYGSWQFASSSKHMSSPLEMDLEEYRHKELTTKEVHEVQNTIVSAARYAKDCGFDALELNCSSDHMFDTFLSRFWNVTRSDAYSGKSLENRARVVTELITKIKDECGTDFPIQILFNGIEENLQILGDNDLCVTLEEAQGFAKLFEAAGADSLHIRSSAFGNHCAGFMPDIMHFGEKGNTGLGTVVNYNRHFGGMVDGSRDGAAAFLDVAAKIKETVKIPVGVVGSMDPAVSEELINRYIKEDKIDFILINRPLLADPELPNKLREGRKDEIKPCNRCVNCFKAVVDMWGTGYCRVNPAYIRGGTEEMPEGAEPALAERPQKVLIIGGGPAGMEAAAIAAQRGHSVSLYEREQHLGGRMRLAAAVKGRHERIAEYIAFMENRLDKLEVEVKLGVKADKQTVDLIAPDKIVVATGGIKAETMIPARNLKCVHDHIILDPKKLGEKVCVVGGNIIAYDYAVHLTAKGKKVALISERLEENIGSEQASWPRAVLTEWMRAKGTRLYGGISGLEISPDMINFTTISGSKEKMFYDSVVILNNLRKDHYAQKEFKHCDAIYIGDCHKPANILEAVRAGNLAGRSI